MPLVTMGGERLRMCGLLPLAADSFRWGMQCFAVSIEPRGPTSNIRLNLRALKSSVACGKMALE